MNRIKDTIFLLLILFAIGSRWIGVKVEAQSAAAVTFTGGAATSTCLTPVTGQTMLCVGTDDIKGSWNGAAYVSLKPGASSTSITLNGTTKTLPASFTIAAASPTVSATAPSITAQ